ncbi:43kDa postsynaptic protein [Parasponia andersonii]|uniref:RING-type E3 ubiquitin transferase n=1 Tax=Parasponia andersonii TaxID=3476 RepID=A0A2P5CNH2_PARAD|nr:43kDa postsynaptic protein [Parasponia andersonii]
MAPSFIHFNHLGFQALPTIKVQTGSSQTHQTELSTPGSAFPILAVALLSIMGTAFLLASYYIFVVKCCSNWHQFNPIRRFSDLGGSRQDDESFIAFSPTTMWNRGGLDASVIREIPTFQFKGGEIEDRSVFGCVVCLNEFQVHDTLRVLPNCSHAFHLDCIDIWLQKNANCPLCRTSISGTIRCPIDQIIAPSSSPQEIQPYSDSLMGSDEDFVVIELGGEEESGVAFPPRQQERDNPEEALVPRSHSPRKLYHNLKVKKCHHVSIMGDECIDVRDHKDDDQFFSVQPLRRSFSWDSATDRQLYSTVQEIIKKNRRPLNEFSTSEGCETRVGRSFFPFRHGRGSRNAIFPFEL